MPACSLLCRAALIGAALLAGPAAAQTVHDEQAWVNLTVQGPIAAPLVYFVEVQPRIGDGVSRIDQLILRGAPGMRVTPRLTLYQGYARVALPVAAGRDRNEERFFQQATWLPPVARGASLSVFIRR